MFLLGLYFQRTIACLLFAVCFPNALGALVASDAEASSISTSISPKSIREKTPSPNEVMNSTTLEASDDVSGNVTSPPNHIVQNLGASNITGESPIWLLNIRSGALERTGYVVLGIMSLLLFVFVIRAIRIRRKSKSRKYGIITSTASEMEMEPLEGRHDDDEEETLFDVQEKYLIK